MENLLGPGTVGGYCTNVHAGADYASMTAALDRHAVAVRAAFCPDQSLSVGLWLSERTAREASMPGGTERLAAFLAERGLRPYTFNGFPFNDFHREVVKYDVYQPDWTTDARRAYTLTLAQVLAAILPPDDHEGSISTLPVGWGKAWLPAARHAAAAQLAAVALELRALCDRTGRLIHVDLEPEPGCLLDTAEDVVQFYGEILQAAPADEAAIRAHLRVCHDICHSAVMFEPQADALATYRAAGIAVGKVQVSAAVAADFDGAGDPQAMRAQLAAFREPRYLHQVVVQPPSGPRRFYDDLPAALATEPPAGQWRVHFHVPIDLAGFGSLTTTQPQIREALAILREDSHVRHYEVETYAWTVLPKTLAPSTLAQGIGRELAWLAG